MSNTDPVVKIRHPRPNDDGSPPQLRKTYFAAFGFALGVDQVYGFLKDSNGNLYPGNPILGPTEDTGFWIIQFVRDDILAGADHKYTFVVDDSDPPSATPLQSVPNVTFLQKSSKHARKSNPREAVDVTYPQDPNEVDDEFAGYGTAPYSTAVSGTIGGSCMGQVMQATPGHNWVVHCMAENNEGVQLPCDGTLTVSQAEAGNGVGSFVLE